MTEALWLTLGLAFGVAAGWFVARTKTPKADADTIRKHPPGLEEKDPYSLRPSVLTAGERSFYDVLRTVLPDDYTVLLKVRLGDLLNVTYGAGNRQSAHAQVCSKSLDFVVCNAMLSPLLTVVLVDGTLGRNASQTRELVDRVLEKVELPIERVPLRPSYDEASLRQLIARHVKLHSVHAEAPHLAISA